jgi:N-glycosylase/DNA lyase
MRNTNDGSDYRKKEGKMKKLYDSIEKLKKSSIRKTVDSRMQEFEENGKDLEKIFSELCFCIMTANFQAEKSIKIQEELKSCFLTKSENELASELKRLGHRFPNMRAKFIAEAQKHHPTLKKKIESFRTEQEVREWVVATVKGLGFKEASHFLRNIGYKDLAIIDFHIVDILADNKMIEKPKSKSLTKKKYLEIESVLRKLGDKTKLSQAELDLYLWYMETGKILK